jgi:dTDP-4-dehydrorhamnose reductase
MAPLVWFAVGQSFLMSLNQHDTFTCEPEICDPAMKIIVLGAAGMLGHKMFQTLRRRFPRTLATIRGTARDQAHGRIGLLQEGNVIEHVDVLNEPALVECLRAHRPDVVVNCIGIVKQRAAAKSHLPSIAINALLPHRLAELCGAWEGRLIHFSTDCVFSGKQGNYAEDDPSDAEDLYGKSKFLGEVQAPNALTLRTSIIGRELGEFRSLLEWFLGQKDKSVQGFTRAMYSGVTTNFLARFVSDVIANHPGLQGLYQVTSPTISKYDLLCLLRQTYRLTTQIVADDSFRCDRSMRGDKLKAAIGFECPPWPDLCAELANDPTPYERWR